MEKEKIWKVYKHTCIDNGKAYVGKTSRSVKERWGKDGKGYITQIVFWRGIQKHGWDRFTHEILADNLTEQEANNLEKYYIKKWDLLNPQKGYNCREGGEGGKMSENTKLKLKQFFKGKMSGENNPMYGIRLTGDKNGMYGKKHTQESKDKISKNKKGKQVGDKNPFFGKHHSEEVKNKLSQIRKGRYLNGNHPRAKKVICLDTKEVFECVKLAGIKYNVCKSSISAVCKGKLKTTGGLRFKYYEDYLKDGDN